VDIEIPPVVVRVLVWKLCGAQPDCIRRVYLIHLLLGWLGKAVNISAAGAVTITRALLPYGQGAYSNIVTATLATMLRV